MKSAFLTLFHHSCSQMEKCACGNKWSVSLVLVKSNWLWNACHPNFTVRYIAMQYNTVKAQYSVQLGTCCQNSSRPNPNFSAPTLYFLFKPSRIFTRTSLTEKGCIMVYLCMLAHCFLFLWSCQVKNKCGMATLLSDVYTQINLMWKVWIISAVTVNCVKKLQLCLHVLLHASCCNL